MFYRLVVIILRIGFTILYRWRVRGVDRLPARGGCVLVANHCNFADPLVLGAAVYPRRMVRFMAKAEIFKWPIVGRLLPWLYVFPVRRNVADRQAIKTALGVVRQGHTLALFPEGTRYRDGRLHELRGGAALVHLTTGAPIVPVGLAGTERMKLFRFPQLFVYVGEPLRLPVTDGLPERGAIAAINGVIREELERCVAEAKMLRGWNRAPAGGRVEGSGRA